MRNLKKREGQRRWVDPNSRSRVSERELRNAEDGARYGDELSAQKSFAGDLGNLSDQHREHSLSIQVGEDAKKVLRTQATALMQTPEYKLPQGDVIGDRTRAAVGQMFESIEGEGVPEDRLLSPSSGAPLHNRIESEVVADE